MRKLALAPILLLCLAATPAASLSDKPYISATDVDFPGLLPPPPTEASPAGKRDLQAILDLQKNMTPERMAAIRTDLDQSVYTIAGPVLGPKFTKANFPMVGAFIDKVVKDGGVGVGPIKQNTRSCVPSNSARRSKPRTISPRPREARPIQAATAPAAPKLR